MFSQSSCASLWFCDGRRLPGTFSYFSPDKHRYSPIFIACHIPAIFDIIHAVPIFANLLAPLFGFAMGGDCPGPFPTSPLTSTVTLQFSSLVIPAIFDIIHAVPIVASHDNNRQLLSNFHRLSYSRHI